MQKEPSSSKTFSLLLLLTKLLLIAALPPLVLLYPKPLFAMGKPESPEQFVPPEDDPNSELNLLRREVRQLQASVRDAALQVATHQEEAINLRKALATVEAELEESLTREHNLRMQLESQRLKKQHIESTMAAAEALVDSLREVVFERQPSNLEPLPPPVMLSRNSSQTSAADDLDRLLSRISDGGDLAKPSDGPPEPKLVSTTDIERTPDAHISPAHHVRPPLRDLLEDRVIGDTASPIDSPLLSAQRPLDDTALTDPTFLPALRLPTSPPPRHRHSMPVPVSRSPVLNAAHARQPSNLLMSAFGTGNVSAANQGHAIRSTSAQTDDQLSAEIVTLAKGDEAMKRHAPCLPSGIRSTISDAHGGEIYTITSSVDGNWVASAGDDKVIKVYDRSGGVFGSISELTRSVTALVFGREGDSQSCDQKLIFAGSSDGAVRMFRKQAKRRPKWALACMYPVHTQTVRKAILTECSGVSTSSANAILSCSTDRTIRISDVESGGRAFSVTTASAVLDVDTFSGNGGGMMVSGHKDGGVRVWSTQEANPNISSGKIHSKGVVSISCLDDGHGVVSLGRDNVLRHCDIRKGVSVVRELDGVIETASDWHRAQTRDRYVACGVGRSGDLGIWNVDNGKITRKLLSQTYETNDDVLDMVARKLRRPGCIVVPHWTMSGDFVCGHRTRQVSFWNTTYQK